MARMSPEEKRIHAKNAIKGQAEPNLNMLTYDEDILAYMNYHSTCSSDTDRRRWVAQGLVAMERRDDIQWFEDSTDFELSQIGPLMWARDRDMYLSNKHLTFIDTEVNRLVAKYKAKAEKPVVEEKKGPTAEEKAAAMARHLYGEVIQGVVDEAFEARAPIAFDMKSWLISNNVSRPVAELIGEKLVPTVLEVKEAVDGEDEQLNESYSNWKKTDLKKLLAYFQGLISAIMEHGQVVKAMRKPRVSKKPKASPVAKLKYLETFMELNMRSVNPETILGADEFYAYRTNRRFIYYKAKEGETLQITGQTISGYDEEKSGAKTVRKPEVFFKNFNTGKVSMRQAFQSITSSMGSAPPRIQDDMILLKAFS